MDQEQMRFFERIYHRYYSRIYNYIFYRVLNVSVADDLVSEVFVKLVKHYRMPGSNISFSAWIFTVMRNLIFDHLHKNPPVRNDAPEGGRHFQNGKHRQIYSVLKSLSDRERSVLAMRFWWGLPYAEIGKYLGLSESNVNITFMRTIKKCGRLA